MTRTVPAGSTQISMRYANSPAHSARRRSHPGVEEALAQTVQYTKDRHAFGKPLFAFQNTKFKLAEVATEARIGRVFVDDCVSRHLRGELDIPTVAMAKWWTTERSMAAPDEFLQPSRRLRIHDRVPHRPRMGRQPRPKIYAGSNEIMKEIIARSL